ncbi:spore germination protein [Paenibacillus sp. MWE-103]|uniref:Spore germination protein n=1 Tax=Paenibacillus artemisiicola TaxID=1172618 RepID=A0ABS3W3U2_9BACL|nr:spore germination protein [Paenibacillus artemisiicola]MBO7742973.1 spore germination protein [Paenibacillus artemisiicola]
MNKQRQDLAEAVMERLGVSPDVVCRRLRTREGLEVSCLYLSSLVDQKLVDEVIIRPILNAAREPDADSPGGEPSDWLQDRIFHGQVKAKDGLDACVEAVLDGHALILLPARKALAMDVCKREQRSVEEPSTESAIRGPREGFVEDLIRNLSLIRKRVKSDKLVFEPMVVGTETKTIVCLAYMRGIASDRLVDEFRARLRAIQTDSILESAYIEEWIQDKSLTPFPQLMATERPDAVAAKLLEGQAAVLTDGTPIALAGPLTFFQLFATPEDYYQRADIATLLRWLRMAAFLLSIFIPALYVSVVSYHQELLPTPLLASLAAQREGVPFPAFLEAMMMMLTFEILREAGLRMPRIAGQAISIVGALVLGQAAVEAGIVSAAIVIVVSLTAICNFVSPMYSFGIAQRIVQFAFLLLAGTLGLFGLMCGFFFLLIHLASLRSFGVRYFAPFAPLYLPDWKDTFVRAPRPAMSRRPAMLRPGKSKR